MNRFPPKAPGARSFTLIELLIVVAIMVLLASVSLPSLKSVLVGSNLNRAGQILSDQILFARQEAVAKNREVRVLLYRFDGVPNAGWSAIQGWRVEQTDSNTVSQPIGRMQSLPDGVVIPSDPGLSPLLTAYTPVVSTNLTGRGAASVAEFRFRPNGFLSGSVTTNNDFLTLQNAVAHGSPPTNYYSIQINPVTGKIDIFRP